MTEIKITLAGLSDRALIRSISERTWPSTYGHIISQEQIDFMLDWMYSDDSLATQMNTGCKFYIAAIKDSKDSNVNNFNILPAAQGTGAGKALLHQAIEVAKAAGSSSIFLQVNKHNNAYSFYLKQGFIKEAEFKFDIGNGFYMDDYVMRLTF